MVCHSCGVGAETRNVSFHQNIGLLIVRISTSTEGEYCKRCIHEKFWWMSGTTLLLGWWGVISFIITPIFLLLNTVQYLMCLRMKPPGDAGTPRPLTAEVIERISPHEDFIVERLNRGEKLADVAIYVAALADGVTPGQVKLYVQAIYGSRAPKS